MVPTGSVLLWWSGFPIAFALTCVIEVPAYLAAFRALRWLGGSAHPGTALSGPRAAALAVGVNVVSHPLLWASALHWPGVGRLLTFEVVVAIVEAGLFFAALRRVHVPDSARSLVGWTLLIGGAVNALSLLLGLALWPVLVTA